MRKICILLFVVIACVGKRADGQLTVLHSFSGSPDGKGPHGDLYYDGAFLYGMTRLGGSNDEGSIFKIRPDGSNYIRLFDLEDTSSGGHPLGSFVSDGNFLYGMTM